jgi:hypothetical protein
LVHVKREPKEVGHADESLRKPKKESALVTSPDAEDDAILEAVMARSLNDVVPVDLQMPMDPALAWSKVEWEREEVERQQRLLEEVVQRRARCVIILDDSEDGGGGPSPTPRRIGAPGQSNSREPQASTPKYDDDFDDSGDYTTFYLHFGM